ncbi:MAG: hypothetical protein K8U57_02220 [Planctomycetes bacterium]|nr:hypothetical protein [Planctomycetota bacterium]
MQNTFTYRPAAVDSTAISLTELRPVPGHGGLARDKYGMQSLVIEIVTSYPFLNRQVAPTNAK